MAATATTTAESATDTDDVSIPYAAPAELAYSEWIAQYDRPYDAKRYEVFKSNYLAITVMNVSTKKQARESGDDSPSLLTLNEYADCTAEEYEAAMNGGSSSSDESSTGDILGEAVAAAESQSAASNALQDAADALAEEEEVRKDAKHQTDIIEFSSCVLCTVVLTFKLAAQLGMESVDELEAAIDAMEGISEEGTAIDGDILAREARVRSAYLEWCKEYGKEKDEARFPQFYDNFLEMEEYAKDSGKEMVLNEFADFTEAEYAAMTAQKDDADNSAAKAELDAAKAAAQKEDEAKAQAAKAAKEAEAKAAADAKAAAQKEVAAKKNKEEEEKKKERAEAGTYFVAKS
ncbi:MAG: hypothetical protein SGARI_000044 [Bacillariaceae sp.]